MAGEGKRSAASGPAEKNNVAASSVSADSVMRASRSYLDLVQALGDSVVEYHAIRRGSEIVSRVNYSQQRRVQRERLATGVASRTRKAPR